MNILIKRVYEPASDSDGTRILVDRLWPRGISKEKARINHWIKELAPSNELRKWYGHDPDNWDEFKQLYFNELDANPERIQELFQLTQNSNVTFLFSSREPALNNAYALREYLLSYAAGKD